MHLNEEKSTEVFIKLKPEEYKLCVINIFSTLHYRHMHDSGMGREEGSKATH
jgi:hypothetical protein